MSHPHGTHRRGRRHNFRPTSQAEWGYLMSGHEDDAWVYPAYTDEPGPHRCSLNTSATKCTAHGERLRSPSGIKWDSESPFTTLMRQLDKEKTDGSH